MAEQLTVPEAQARELLIALGFQNTEKRPVPWVRAKLVSLPAFIDQMDQIPEMDEDTQDLMEQVVEACDEGTGIVVESTPDDAEKTEEPQEAPAEEVEPEVEEIPATDPEPAPKEVKPEPKPKKAPKAKSTKRTRVQCTVEIIQTMTAQSAIDLEALVSEADDAYAKSGGKHNPKEARWSVRHTIQVLLAIGMVEKKDDGALWLA